METKEEKRKEKEGEKRKEKKRFVLIIRQFALKGNNYRFRMIFTKSDSVSLRCGRCLFCHISPSSKQ